MPPLYPRTTRPAFGTLLVFALLTAGCTRQPGTFRLTAPGNVATLIPPGSKDATVVRAALPIAPVPRKTPCSASPHGLTVDRKWYRGPRVVVTTDALNSTPAAELFNWTAALEKQGCIPANQAFGLAESIIDALPLPLAKRRQLLQGRSDLKSANSLSVVSPVLKPGATGSLAETQSVTQSVTQSITQGETPGSLTVDVKASPSVIGYEIDWYDVQPQADGPGFRIVPRSAEIHTNGNVEHPSAPTVSRFQFAPDARWYELYMMTKVSENDFDFVVSSARNSGELLSHAADFRHDAAGFLRSADPATYTVLPHGSGINAFIRVKVNGVTLDLPRGNTIRQAISQTAGTPATSQSLRVFKPHNGKLYPVEWDRATDQIFSLPLEGGEEISW
jgi:hypothetical protein